MATQIIDPTGAVVIEQLEYTPAPGEVIEVDGKRYVVGDGPPVTRLVKRGPNVDPKYMRVVMASPSGKSKQQQSGGRGPAVMG